MKETTLIYDIAKEFSENTSRAIFLTGKAGTGKTTFLKKLCKETRKQIAVVAPTGVAAINAGGVTIHSFFQLPFTPFAPTDEGRKNLIRQIKMNTLRRKILQKLEILVIDEISMVRADLLDSIDTVLRHARYRKDIPFGGVQVIYIGDLYQLPPVTVPEEWDIIAHFYRTPYFFDSHVVQQQPPVYIELDKIFRQTNADFVRLLNEVRNNTLSDEGFQLLKSRFHPSFTLDKHPDYIFLTTHNASATRINKEEMCKLKGRTFTFHADVKGDFPEKIYPNDPALQLKKGAKVMFIANDGGNPRRYYNGKIAIVTKIDDGNIFVRSDEDDEDILVKHEIWQNTRYSINKQTGQIEETVLGTYTQYPLRLAWAITIHKSQGLTFDKVIVDAANAFSSGQVYVALSRCRTLEGLVLNSPIRRESLAVDLSVVEYANTKLPTETLKNALDGAREEYNEYLLRCVYDFQFAQGQMNTLQASIRRNTDYYNEEGIRHANALQASINDLQNVGTKFQWQIHELYASDKEMLATRLKDAAKYFGKQLDDLMHRTSHSPAEIFDGDAAKEYKEEMQILFNEFALKQHIIKDIHKGFSIESYYKLKDSFRLPKYNLKRESAFEEALSRNERRQGRPAPKVKKKKSEDPPTHLISLGLYNEGKSIEQVAEERKLTVSTIETHLAKCIQEEAISIGEFMTAEETECIQEMLKQCDGKLSEVFSALEGNVSYGRIRMAAADLELKSK